MAAVQDETWPITQIEFYHTEDPMNTLTSGCMCLCMFTKVFSTAVLLVKWRVKPQTTRLMWSTRNYPQCSTIHETI